MITSITPLQTSKVNQSHKGGCPQEALILSKLTVFWALFSLQLFWGLLKKRAKSNGNSSRPIRNQIETQFQISKGSSSNTKSNGNSSLPVLNQFESPTQTLRVSLKRVPLTGSIVRGGGGSIKEGPTLPIPNLLVAIPIQLRFLPTGWGLPKCPVYPHLTWAPTWGT